MKYICCLFTCCVSLLTMVYAQEAKLEVVKPAEENTVTEDDSDAKKEQLQLAAKNALEAEKLKSELADLKARIARIKLEKEVIAEELALDAEKRKLATKDQDATFADKLKELTRLSQIAKSEAEKSASEMKIKQAEWQMETAKLNAEITRLETENKRDIYANAKPVYLDDPLEDDGTLVISDRRISLNGPITLRTADHITTRINFFNNKDAKKPIFIVIDTSPGGSVMAGYRILKAMEGSTAPVYVVVKSFAASMAATICTLADKSFVYPNSIILHHQISQSFFFSSMNLTEQKENVEDLKKWWQRLAKPIADKMGITTDQFIEMMYKKTVTGDWTEFGDEAVKLKWADYVVQRIHETSLLKNPDSIKPAASTKKIIGHGLEETVDDNGKPIMYLPRLTPKDCYFLYNKDGYYRLK